MNNQRKEERIALKGNIVYIPTSLTSAEKVCSGLISNYSDSGVCIYTQEHLREKESIQLYFNEISKTPINAKVMWCNRNFDDLYMVGLALDT